MAAMDIVNVGVPLLMMMLVGFLIGYFKVWTGDYMQAVFFINSFVFYCSVPATVFKGIATKDFFKLDWDFVAVFLLLRIITGASLALYSWLNPLGEARERDGVAGKLSMFLSHWIGTTWINTIIFGIPILVSLYGPHIQILNILAAISSLFFQLPTMLFLFEVRGLYLQHSRSEGGAGDVEPHDRAGSTDSSSGDAAVPMLTVGAEDSDAAADEEDRPTDAAPGQFSIAWSNPVVWKDLVKRMLSNPPLVFIILGLLYSLIITSNVEVDSPKDKNKVFPVILDKFSTFLAETVTPCAAVSIGLFMNGPFLTNFRKVWKRVMMYLIVKLLVLPFVCCLVVLMLNVESGIKARSAVYIASLPISISSFTLAKKYELAKEELSSSVALGTILMLPTAVFWEAVFDTTGWFDDSGEVFKPG